MRGKYPQRIRELPEYDGRFDACRVAAGEEHAARFERETDEIEFWFESR